MSNGYDQSEWENVEVVEVVDTSREGCGIRVRAYKKASENTVRIGFNEYWTDKNSNEKKFGKQIRISPIMMKEFGQALKTIFQKVNPNP